MDLFGVGSVMPVPQLVTIVGIVMSLWKRSITPFVVAWLYTFIVTGVWRGTQQKAFAVPIPEPPVEKANRELREKLQEDPRQLSARTQIFATEQERIYHRPGVVDAAAATRAYDDSLMGETESAAPVRRYFKSGPH